MQTPSLRLLSNPSRPPRSPEEHARLIAFFTDALEHQRDAAPSPDALTSRLLPLVRLAAAGGPAGSLAGHLAELTRVAGADAAEPLAGVAASLARAGDHAAARRLVMAARRALAPRSAAGAFAAHLRSRGAGTLAAAIIGRDEHVAECERPRGGRLPPRACADRRG